MCGKPPFEVAESFVGEVSNLEAARNWYKEKLEFREAPNDVPDDSGKPYLALALSGEVPEIVLMEKDPKGPGGW